MGTTQSSLDEDTEEVKQKVLARVEPPDDGNWEILLAEPDEVKKAPVEVKEEPLPPFDDPYLALFETSFLAETRLGRKEGDPIVLRRPPVERPPTIVAKDLTKDAAKIAPDPNEGFQISSVTEVGENIAPILRYGLMDTLEGDIMPRMPRPLGHEKRDGSGDGEGKAEEGEDDVVSLCDFSDDEADAAAKTQAEKASKADGDAAKKKEEEQRQRQKRRSSVADFIAQRRSSGRGASTDTEATAGERAASAGGKKKKLSAQERNVRLLVRRLRIMSRNEQKEAEAKRAAEGGDGGDGAEGEQQTKTTTATTRTTTTTTEAAKAQNKGSAVAEQDGAYHGESRPAIGASEEQGNRKTMEDAMVFFPNPETEASDNDNVGDNTSSGLSSSRRGKEWLWFAGVFDGHGGSAASTFLQRHLATQIQTKLEGAFAAAAEALPKDGDEEETKENDDDDDDGEDEDDDDDDEEELSWHPSPDETLSSPEEVAAAATRAARARRAAKKAAQLARRRHGEQSWRVGEALAAAFREADDEFLSEEAGDDALLLSEGGTSGGGSGSGDGNDHNHAGATATTLIRTPDGLYCANTGDSRTVLCFLQNHNGET